MASSFQMNTECHLCPSMKSIFPGKKEKKKRKEKKKNWSKQFCPNYNPLYLSFDEDKDTPQLNVMQDAAPICIRYIHKMK